MFRGFSTYIEIFLSLLLFDIQEMRRQEQKRKGQHGQALNPYLDFIAHRAV